MVVWFHLWLKQLLPNNFILQVKEEVDMKYEYVTVPLLTHATKQILDTWGSDGWELVQVIPAPGGGEQLVAYMKREIK
jgi:hypothetical protein